MRWKGIIAFLVLTLIIGVFAVFFADGIIKSTIESVGGSVNGAKVEINKFELSPSKLLLHINGIQIADPDNEFQNQFEARDVRFKVELKPLFYGKIYITDMSIEGIRKDTKRTTSGKLPLPAPEPEEIAPVKEEVAKQQGIIEQEANSMPVVQAFKGEGKINVDELVKPERMQAPAEAQKTQTEINTKYQGAQTALNTLNIQPRIDEIKKQIDAIDLKEKNPAKLAKEAKKLKGLKDDVEKLKDDLSRTGQTVRSDLESSTNAIKHLDQVKEQDYNSIIQSIAEIKGVGKDEIAPVLFGKPVLGQVNTLLYWLKIAKRFFPADDEPSKPKPKRLKGQDIEFPKDKGYPGFTLNHAALNTGKSNSPDELKFDGKIESVTSNPRLYGKPTTFYIKADNYEINGLFDHTVSIHKDTCSITFTSVDLGGLGLVKSPLLPSRVNKGRAEVKVLFTEEPARTDGRSGGPGRITLDMTVLPRELSFAPEDIPPGELAKEVTDAITTAQNIRIEVKLTIEKGKPSFKVNSTLDEIISQRIKQLANRKIDEAKAQVKARVNEMVDKKKEELLGNLQAKKTELENLLKNKDESVGQLKEQLKAKLDKLDK